MSTEIRSSGTWAGGAISAVRDSATWKNVKAIWIRASGIWQHIAPNMPKGVAAIDQSFCDAGTPDYRTFVSWTNQHPGMQTKIYRDGVLVNTAAAGVGGWQDGGVGGVGTFAYRVSHIDSEGLESDLTTAVNVTTVFPC